MIKGIHVRIENQEELDALFEFVARKGNNKAFQEAFPRAANALLESAQMIQGAWKNYVMGYSSTDFPRLGIRDIPTPSSELASTIEISPNEPGAFAYTVYSDNPAMVELQNGKTETIDMKAPGSPWLNGKKSRLNKKDGSPYLIVPFGWGTKGKTGGSAHFRNVVPSGIQRMLRSREISKSLRSTHFEPNAKGEQIERPEYNWGGRISPEEAETHGDKRMAGMIRMWDSSYSNRTVGNYFTFRVISAKAAAEKWIQHRKIDARDMIGALKREYEARIQERITNAFAEDCEAGL